MANKSRSSTLEDGCARIVAAHGLNRLDEHIRDGLFGKNTARARTYLRKRQLENALPRVAAVALSLIGTLASVVSCAGS